MAWNGDCKMVTVLQSNISQVKVFLEQFEIDMFIMNRVVCLLFNFCK